jgi:hypothetical protein
VIGTTPPFTILARSGFARKLEPTHGEQEMSVWKAGAKVVSHCRYVDFQMAEVAIPRILFADILRLVGAAAAPGSRIDVKRSIVLCSIKNQGRGASG